MRAAPGGYAPRRQEAAVAQHQRGGQRNNDPHRENLGERDRDAQERVRVHFRKCLCLGEFSGDLGLAGAARPGGLGERLGIDRAEIHAAHGERDFRGERIEDTCHGADAETHQEGRQ
ncbi:MAG: hypothetical protein WEA77_11615 [Hyphomonas sp.]